MAVSTSTEYTKKVYSDFASYTVKKNKAMIIIYICSAIIIAAAIALFFLNETSDAILYLCLGVLFGLYGVLMRFIIILTNKKNVGSTDAFSFEETNFKVVGKNNKAEELGSATINYSTLYDLKFYKNYAYIYVNKVMCYIVLKQNFKTEEEFNSVMQNIQNNIKRDK